MFVKATCPDTFTCPVLSTLSLTKLELSTTLNISSVVFPPPVLAFQLLSHNGYMVFIVSDVYNASKYAEKSHEYFINECRIERMDFCSEIPLFDAGVTNTIIHYVKTKAEKTHKPIRVRRWGNDKGYFEFNQELLITDFQQDIGKSLFRPEFDGSKDYLKNVFRLEMICFISVGMVINADERQCQSAFNADDVLSEKKDKLHPKRFVLGKDILKWICKNIRFLEWGTVRAPNKFRRKTFTELHEAKEKLLTIRTPGAIPKVIYDDDAFYFDASSVGFVHWHLLKGVENKSIIKTSKYKHQVYNGDREEREKISRQFHIKYILAVMNSDFAKEWLDKRRRSRVHIYPDDWKKLPIVPISVEEQKEFVKLVDAILAEFKKHGYPLPLNSVLLVKQWEDEINKRVDEIYSNQQS